LKILKKISNYFIAIIIIIGTVLFFWGGPDYYANRSIKYIWNFGHIIFYCILSSVLLLNCNKLKAKSYYYQVLWVVIITVFLGLIVEFIQAGINRTPEMGDLSRNFMGSFIALLFFAPKNNEAGLYKLCLLKCTLIIIILFQILPVINLLRDEHNAKIEFPLLSGFESKLELSRWTGDADFILSKEIKNTGNSSLVIELNTSKYSGISLKCFPRNWDLYHILSLKIYNPQNDSLKITCRIHDKKHTEGKQVYTDRFNKTYTLLNGWNTIEINLNYVRNAPLQRKMDIDKINGFGIFVISQKENKTIYLDDVLLKK
ncbi:MAG: VanZ family protein, partial [Desulfobacteraceae bacterium]|nr:VanZ family protein [Desulfobacteraceae bacterium]